MTTGCEHNYVRSILLRRVLIAIGWLSVVTGVIGLFLPIMPTVPFLLLAVACFNRSSVRFHTWLVEHNYLGPLLKDYLNDGGVRFRVKVLAICMIWISFPTSALFFAREIWLKITLLSVAAGVTAYLLYLPTIYPDRKPRQAVSPPEE